MTFGIAFGNIVLKDVRNYYLKPPNISWGLVFPVAWTLMLFLRSESAINIRDVLPGVMAMSILFGTTSMLAVTMTFERKSRSFDRLLLSPISLNGLMLAKTSGAILFGIFNAFVPVLFAAFFIDLSNINVWTMMIGAVLLAVTSTFLGLFISVSVKEVFEAQTFSNFFRFPMLFLCGLFIPVHDLPIVIRPLSFAIPVTYGTDLLKDAINQNGFIPIPVSLIVLVGFSIGLFLLSTRTIKRKWIA
jgi:ABC-2 type transport system permease protein